MAALTKSEITQAAQAIREHARATSGGTEHLAWFDADVDLRNTLRAGYGMYERDDCSAHADARWIADMSPSLGVHLADLIDLINSNHQIIGGKPTPELRAVREICREILDNAICARIFQ